MKKILLLLVSFYCVPLFSQEKSINIVWGASQIYSTDSYSVTIPTFTPAKNFSFDMANGIHFVEQWQVSGFVNENSLVVSDIVYLPISKSDLKNLNLIAIPENITASLKNGTSRDVNYAVLSLSPIIKQGNSYKKVVSFKVNYDMNVTSSYRRSTNRMITNSVLTNGDWYKFEVEKSGVHKISKSFLNQMGVNVNSFDPRNIKVFGNGGKMMPFANNADFPFDPTENAIKIVGEEDGVFNDEDYILFYAQGPSADVNLSYVNTNINPYTDKTVYYINISSGQGKRIQNFSQPTGIATADFNTFQDYQFHEIDEKNIIFVGRRWFGEEFGVESSQSFDFVFPNLEPSEAVNVKVVTATTASSTSRFLVSVNDAALGSVSLSGTNTANGVYVTGGTFDQTTNVVNDNVSVRLDYDNQGNPSAEAYLDYISVEATRALTFNGTQFHFKNKEATIGSGIANYIVSNAAQVQEIWDVSNLYDVTAILNSSAESTFTFKAPMGAPKTFVTVSSQSYLEPSLAQNSNVNNQNLKGTIFLNSEGNFQDVDYLMLTTQSHATQARRLAQINRDKKNLNVKVVVVDDIYTEFSSGNPDISGIRNFVKYVYDNASTPDNRVKYLCIFGDSSFDYKGRISSNTYNFPTWNAYSSFNLSSSFISDDYYAYVDLNEGVLDQFNNANKLDIAVGRILADSPLRAKQMVDKIEVYYSKGALGSWRNNFIVVSDDVDEAWEETLQKTTDEIADEVALFKPYINVTKIHSDAYEQQASAGGDRYPGVTEALTNAIEKGAIMVNYFGHGGEDGLAHERIFQKDDVVALNNVCKLNLFVTVTCEFTRFDNPLRETAGELIYWNKDAGSIALITTTRQIFVEVGKDLNKILKEYLFSYSTNDTYSDFEYPTVAEALRLAKNDPNFSNAQKSLAFYIGDPALTLAFPEPNIRLTTINDVPITQETDVLQALGYAKLAGEVTDVNGNVLNGYNGIVITTIYDKEIERVTLANDNTRNASGLIKLNFTTLGAVVFKGQATVTNGQFEFDFIVPKDIGIPVGTGKISFYATQENALEDKTGASTEVLKIGGINPNAAEDNIGPTIQLYMNDEAFVSGGITNESPLLLANFEDENGINTASGIGHDIVALLDGDEVNPYVLNDYYLTEVDDYTKGALSFSFKDLEPGLHTLTLKAWDVYNNSATAEIQFIVFNENESLVINNVLNYPNPFVNYTEFWFSHNSSEVLDISVQIFTVSGKLVRTLNGQTALAGGKSTKSTSRDIVWDGRDDFGDKIGKGTYIYKLKVHSQSTNKSVEKIEKLVIL
ncbi:type IX secretion system sortase PorU [Psychroserpens sp. NJDZ02]|uniref:type IX secretion system sortase PorU n=1 Tax=Psychroserpens sp. NJDZ02 TaxID=2570561 RepID=UPI0010A7F9AB|nr:type IX secretion system sortase PorU [Psychroserpens sp. NJDZ02]QCE41713.1 type IX secretion system sortase PorU [Psychroserpens sp. NJDZ02]